MKKTILIALSLCFSIFIQAQKPIPEARPVTIDKSNITIRTDHRAGIPRAGRTIFDQANLNFNQSLTLHRNVYEPNLKFISDPKSGLPVHIKGELQNPNRTADTPSKCLAYLDAIKSAIKIEAPAEEFFIKKQSIDDRGIEHVRMEQYFNGIRVFGSEVMLHLKDGAVYLFNGRYYPTPQIENLLPAIDKSNAEQIVQNEFPNWKQISNVQHSLISHDQLRSELIIYHTDEQSENGVLAWKVDAIPALTQNFTYFIDAIDGTILHHFSNVCQLYHHDCSHHQDKSTPTPKKENTKAALPNMVFGPETAQATDLQGQTRTINVYETGGTYFMIDASRTMHNPALSDFPNNPTGVIWTIDAFNTSPANNNFTYDHVTSGNNSWNAPTAVSAQYNGGLAYEYFKNTFGRESINGQGGNIVSFINVADENGNDMDNAFWNGAAMFYGNGDQAFNAPLAKALDVAGHEISHGVIQNEANLIYQNEPGALNESFADIFGAMIDRDDWKIGEEISNPSVFPSGTMRDMQNPNNGGNSNNFYWQPMHVNEQYTGNQDNGGVHINSGIPNHAYYLFATSVGKDVAEEIFYDVLTNYLVASSQFVDLRFAVVEATTQTYGANAPQVDAANSAFNAVGIGEGGGDDYQDDISVNTGTEFIMWSDLNLNNINNSTPNGTFDGTFSTTSHISRPSITDDGSIILYIDDDNRMKEIDIDWSTGTILNEFTIQDSPIWRNVATSKDGTKLAAITTDNSNEIFVFDFITSSSQWYELYNPTTADGVSTGDVQFPDVLEWDFTGEFVLYDALNELSGQNGTIEYWDIGFLKVWENDTDNFGDGQVSKLFSGLPENVSVGNPTFSKNSPYIIAFDFIASSSQGTEFEVLGANIQTGEQGLIWQNNTLGYPSYSVNDEEIIFSTISGNDQIIGIRGLQPDKINGTGDAFIIIEDATWATWFATGDRELTSTADLNELLGITVFPNPVNDELTIQSEGFNLNYQYELYDLMGRRVRAGIVTDPTTTLNLSGIGAGTYALKIYDEEKMGTYKIIKQ